MVDNDHTFFNHTCGRSWVRSPIG